MPAQVPASIEAEEAILGSLILYPNTYTLAYEQNLQPSDFFVEANRKIYQVICALESEKKPIDYTNVITRLTDLQQLNSVGGAEYILKLTDLAISSVNCEFYIKNIQEKALLRKLIEVTEDVKKKCLEGQFDPYDVLNEAESSILKVSRERKTTEFLRANEVFDSALKHIREQSKIKGLDGVPSGFKYLDEKTNGFHASDLIILAARPAVGKTAFALNIAANAACSSNKAVAIFDLEMPAIQLANRMLAAKANVDLKKISTGNNLSNDEWGRLDSARNELSKAKIYIDDSSNIKVNDIFAKCRKLKESDGLDLVIIDYLQLIMGNSKRNDNRQQEVSEISRSLKLMARELNVPVICLSQLSRDIEKDKQYRDPTLADLRESGAIEQDADIVMFLHPSRQKKTVKQNEGEEVESNNEVNEEKQKEIKLIIGKHRNGSTGTIYLAFEGAVNTFYTKVFREDEYNEG